MKLWVDDERPAPDDSWSTAKDSHSARVVLALCHLARLEEVSLDHDLGGEDNGMIVLNCMADHAVWPATLTIHTANPPARERMLAAANADAPDWVDINVIYL